MEVQVSYLHVLRLATSRSANEDRPGTIVNPAQSSIMHGAYAGVPVLARIKHPRVLES
jgi:hypothetical protein